MDIVPHADPHGWRAGLMDVAMRTYLWINEEALSADCPSVEAYESEGHLVAELHADVAAGRTCFVTSNSKVKVEKLAAALSDVAGARGDSSW